MFLGIITLETKFSEGEGRTAAEKTKLVTERELKGRVLVATRVSLRVSAWALIVKSKCMDDGHVERHLFTGRTSEGRRRVRGEIQETGVGAP